MTIQSRIHYQCRPSEMYSARGDQVGPGHGEKVQMTGAPLGLVRELQSEDFEAATPQVRYDRPWLPKYRAPTVHRLPPRAHDKRQVVSRWILSLRQLERRRCHCVLVFLYFGRMMFRRSVPDERLRSPDVV